MPSKDPIAVRLVGGRRIDATIRGHVVHTDQPVDNGGENSAPTPFELFLASLATCAGIFVQGFCARRDIPFEDIELVQRAHEDENGVLQAVELELHLPKGFPEKYRDAVVRATEGCSVKKAIAAQPEIRISAVLG